MNGSISKNLSTSPNYEQQQSIGLAVVSGRGGRGAAPPLPINNMGVEFSIHYLSVTFWQSERYVASFVCRLLGIERDFDALELFALMPYGTRGYRVLFVGPGGIRIAANPTMGSGHVHVDIPGEVAKSICVERWREFEKLDCRFKVTRLDTAFDTTLFTPAQVYDAVAAGEVRTLAKRNTLQQIIKYDGGHTTYLGSRTSERFLRCYKKADERGEFTRFEIEYKGKRAHAVFADLLKLPEDWAKRSFAHLRDFIDFGADWWDEFCRGIERANMVLARIVPTFQKKVEWLKKQVAPNLALFEEILGFRALVQLVDGGRKRFRSQHWAMLASNASGLAI